MALGPCPDACLSSPPPLLKGWEETAAKFVSISTELRAVAALATRWRQLELASWRTTLKQVWESVEGEGGSY